MGRILVVDDEPDIVYLLEIMLRGKGHDVVGVRSGEECLQMLKEAEFDLILLDVLLPGLTGWEVVRRMKDDGVAEPTTVALMSTREMLETGEEPPYSVARIEKPFDTEELLRTVEQLVHG